MTGVVEPRSVHETDSTVTGSAHLLALVLRRDRVQLPVWVAAVTLFVLASAASLDGVYPDPASLQQYAALVHDNAAVVVQAGPGYGLQTDPTLGAVLMNEVSMWSLVLVGIMSIFWVTRHTRAEEESERAELLRSSPVGRHAAGVAAMLGALIANSAVAGAVWVGLVMSGFDPVGAAAFGCALVATGMVFAGVTLVTAQIASSGRAATGMALAVVGISFALRAVGDVTGNLLTWLSPIGWGQAIRAFAQERWWVLVMPLCAVVALGAAASSLGSHRDFGSGMLAERGGRAEAGRWLATPYGLAWRMLRGAFIGWVAGIAVFGAFYGAVTNEVEKMVADNPDLGDFFAQAGGGSITDSFLASAATILSLLMGGAALSAVLRLRTEEAQGRVDPLLATPLARGAWAGGHLWATLTGTMLVAVAAGLGLGVGAAVVTDEVARIPQMLAALVAFVPAVAVLASIGFAIWGLAPKAALVSWVGLVWAVVTGLFAELLDLPQWARDLSPLEHVPGLPAEGFSVAALVVMVLLSAALSVVGFAGLARRDISS